MSPVIPVVLCMALVQAHLSLQMFLCPLATYPQGRAFFWAVDTSPTHTPVTVVIPYRHPPPTPTLQKLRILARNIRPGHFGAAPSVTLSLHPTLHTQFNGYRPSHNVNTIPTSSPLKETPIKCLKQQLAPCTRWSRSPAYGTCCPTDNADESIQWLSHLPGCPKSWN